MYKFKFNLFLFLCLSFLFACTTNVIAQRPIDLAERAMSAGNYDDAIKYYQQEYDITNDKTLTEKINLAQTLKTEFGAVDNAISNNKFDLAEAHLQNVLLIDPSNTFVNVKRGQIKSIKSENAAGKRRRVWRNFSKGFHGDDDIQELLGGFHLQIGPSFTKYNNLDYQRCWGLDMGINAYRRFPLSFDINSSLTKDYQSIGIGIGSAYLFSEQFCINYGIGWQKHWLTTYSENNAVTLHSDSKNYYFRVGATFMFSEDLEAIGGLSYSYIHSIGGTTHPVSTHLITYTCGRGVSVYVGLLGILAVLGYAAN